MVGVAEKVTLEPEQMVVADADTITEGVSVVLTVMFTGADVTVSGVAQAAVEVMMQVISSPSFSEALV